MNRFSPERLARLMRETGITQAELARKMGISKSSLSRILRGQRSPGSRFVAALKVAFPDTPMESFFEIGPRLPDPQDSGGRMRENGLRHSRDRDEVTKG